MKPRFFISEGVRRMLSLLVKTNVLLILCCILMQCSDQHDDTKPHGLPQQDISIAELSEFLASAYGLPVSKIQYRDAADGQYFVIEGDLLMKRETAEFYYKEAQGKNPQGRSKQRRLSNLVNQTTVTDVKVRILSGVPTDWAEATRAAMANWNAVLGTKLTFREVTSDEHIQIFVGAIANPDAIAEAPGPSSGGQPGSFVRIDDGHLGEPSKLFTMAHELGHTIGLSHTNTSEGSFITGTPVNDPLSVMNAFVLPWSGFTSGDVAAVQILYPITAEELYIVRSGTVYAADYSTGVGLDINTGWNQTVAMAGTGGFIYTVTGGSMYRINPNDNTAVYFSAYPNGWAGTEAMTALGGYLYAAAGGTLWRVTISNGAVAPFSDYPNGWANTEAMTAIGSYIYAVSEGSLWQVNISNGDVTPFSDYPDGWTGTEGMAAYGGYLYAVQGGTMWRVNLSNGDVEPFGDYSDGWAGTEALTIKDGYLFASQGGALWKLNLSTGSVVQLGPSNWTGTEAMAARL